MIFNRNVFFLASPPHLLLWNCETHQQFLLSQEHVGRLLELIKDPSRFDESFAIDKEFLDTKIVQKACGPHSFWGWDVLSSLYHVGTKNIPFECQPTNPVDWAKLYFAHCDETLSKPFPCESFSQGALSRVVLHTPFSEGASLIDSLECRKTSRNFYDNSVSLESISTILFYSLGYQSARQDTESALLSEGFRYRRTSPSGGGLNATEGYLYAYNVDSLNPGIYYYNPKDHTLEWRNDLPTEKLGNLLNGQHFINNLPFGIFLTSRLDKLWWKYEHSRAYRMALIEVGHIAQTIQLMATSREMQTWLTGALNEEPIERLINSTTGTEEVFFFVGAGYGDGKAIPADLRQEISEGRHHE